MFVQQVLFLTIKKTSDLCPFKNPQSATTCLFSGVLGLSLRFYKYSSCTSSHPFFEQVALTLSLQSPWSHGIVGWCYRGGREIRTSRFWINVAVIQMLTTFMKNWFACTTVQLLVIPQRLEKLQTAVVYTVYVTFHLYSIYVIHQ